MALLAASERYPILVPSLSLAVLAHAIFSLGGYCFANARVRQNLTRSVMKCMGKKVPLLESTSIGGIAATSTHNISGQSVSKIKLYFLNYLLICCFRDQPWRTEVQDLKGTAGTLVFLLRVQLPGLLPKLVLVPIGKIYNLP